jgi:23S rRNA pseudouridine2605 synthase
MDNYKKPEGNRRGKQTPDSRKGKSVETRPSYSRRRDEDDPPREKKTYSSSRPSSPRKREDNEAPREKRAQSSSKLFFPKKREDSETAREKRAYSSTRTSSPRKRDDTEAPREKRSYTSSRPTYSRRDDENETPRKKRDNPSYPKRRDSDSRPSGLTRKPKAVESEKGDLIRLNRYIANAGICSRREADKLIEAGAVQVNGKVVTELGTKVALTDKISYGEQALSREKLRYVLLNKPKGFITTTDDPENRKTVMTLIARACKERIYPVGRLDRNTTGLLLFTNDGEIAKRLSHPRYGIKKIYHVGLDKNVTAADMKSVLAGVELEDGLVKADAIEFVGDGKDKKEIGLELHTGQNRVVRRIFEKLGYKVVKLDRVYYAGLTKKNLPRGEWRFLEEKELNMLKMIGT